MNNSYIFHTALFGKYNTVYGKYSTVGHVCNIWISKSSQNEIFVNQKCFKPVKAPPHLCNIKNTYNIALWHGSWAKTKQYLN